MKCEKCGGQIVKEEGRIASCNECGYIPRIYKKQAEKEYNEMIHKLDDIEEKDKDELIRKHIRKFHER